MIKIILAILNIFIIQYVFGLIIPSEGMYLAIDPVTMLIISGVTSAAQAGISLHQANKAKDDMRDAELKAGEYIDKAYQNASINAQRMRSIDTSLYDTASEQISQDLSTVLGVTAGEDARLAAAQGSRLAQTSARERQALEMQKRKDIQGLEKDIAEGEQSKLARLQALDQAQAIGYQQQAADAQQRKIAAQQQALSAGSNFVNSYTGMINAGISPQQLGFGGGKQTSIAPPTPSQFGMTPFTPQLGAQSQLLNNTQQPEVNTFGASLMGQQTNPLLAGLTLQG